MLISIEDGEYEFQHLLEKMVQQVLIAFVDVDNRFMIRTQLAVVVLEKVEVKRLFRKRFLVTLEKVLLDPAVRWQRRNSTGKWRWLIRAERGDC